MADGRAMEPADILNTIMDTGWTGYSGSKLDSMSLAWLLELEVVWRLWELNGIWEEDVLSTQGWRCQSLRAFRAPMWDLSTYVRSEHLWTCFMCNENDPITNKITYMLICDKKQNLHNQAHNDFFIDICTHIIFN